MPAPAGDNVREIEANGLLVKQRSGELRRLVSDETKRKALDSLDYAASQLGNFAKEYLRFANSGRFEDAHAILQDKMVPIMDKAEKAAKLPS